MPAWLETRIARYNQTHGRGIPSSQSVHVAHYNIVRDGSTIRQTRGISNRPANDIIQGRLGMVGRDGRFVVR